MIKNQEKFNKGGFIMPILLCGGMLFASGCAKGNEQANKRGRSLDELPGDISKGGEQDKIAAVTKLEEAAAYDEAEAKLEEAADKLKKAVNVEATKAKLKAAQTN